MQIQGLRRTLLFFIASVSLAAQSAAVQAATSGPPIEIPAIIPITGPAAFVGVSQQQGLQVLEQSVNARTGIRGRPVRFRFYDDQGNPQLSVQLFNQVAAGGAQVIIGGAFSALCKAVAPLATPPGPVLYCLSPAVVPTPNSYVFSASIHPLDLIAGGLRYFHARGMNRVALLVGTDATGQEVDQNLETILAKPGVRGINIIAHEHYGTTDVTATAQATKIVALHPDAVVVWSGTGLATPLRSLNDAGSQAPVLLCNAVQTISALTQFASFLPKQLYFAVGQWGAYPNVRDRAVKAALGDYFDAFKTAGIKPDEGNEISWDPGLLVIEALRQLGPEAKSEQIHTWLENLHGFVASNGYYDFRNHDQRGLNPNDVVMTLWDPQGQSWKAAGR